MDKRGRGRNIEYLVRWDGYDEDEDSWEPASSLSHAHDAIDTYLGKGKVSLVIQIFSYFSEQSYPKRKF